MRGTLTSLVLLAAVSIPGGSQTIGTIQRVPRTTFVRGPLLSPVSPAAGRKGQQNLTLQLNGVNTHFSNETNLSMGDGITSQLTVLSPTSATAVVNIGAGTAAGSRTVTLTTGSEVVSLNEGFTVTENPDQFGKACAAASTLSSVGPGLSQTATGWLDLSGVQEWFTVTVRPQTIFKLSLSGVGPGSEFELSVTPSCGGGTVASTTPGASPKQLMLPPSNVSQTFVIHLYASRWKAESSRFVMTLSGEPLP